MISLYGKVIDIRAPLEKIFKDRLSFNEALREHHGNDVSWHEAQLPDAVVFPKNNEEIQKLVKLAVKERIPLIAFGAGTSLEAHIHAPFGGISVDLSKMNEVISFCPEDMTITVQAGVTRKQLDSYLKGSGLFFPIDPGADATIGGMVATRASGTNAVRYGTMSDAVLNLAAIMPNGEIIKTGRRAKKSSAGYDLTHLLIGSEGTLGLITEITLRLHGVPEKIIGGYCPFPDIESACNAAILAIQSGIPVARMELLDKLQVKASNQHDNLNLQETPTLFVEFHGSPTSAKEQAELFNEIVEEFDGGPFSYADKMEERNALWTARHEALWAAKAYCPGKHMIITDICVPISKLADAILATQGDLDDLNLTAPLVGHVGDGNFHLFLMVDETDADEVSRAKELLKRLVHRAHDMDGTCTGEHGIGKGKKEALMEEHGEAVVNLMRTLKSAIDTGNIFNPGNIF